MKKVLTLCMVVKDNKILLEMKKEALGLEDGMALEVKLKKQKQ